MMQIINKTVQIGFTFQDSQVIKFEQLKVKKRRQSTTTVLNEISLLLRNRLIRVSTVAILSNRKNRVIMVGLVAGMGWILV